ncbi:hypothetical protein HMPREF0063_11107 [Aeromicrobium marinum DSM 15272]|uniref:Uncharacterized protein n=1 Tax=Aeromicrobium marinum DSM 15272 TaxID=585531 RepID=E2SAP9_9ACTN|nr:hypothetical protein [Aeromicrobium marinum]EFQ83445.1 hypothetical protein HMPREF0063_11107 [Aeromicrobium marinum DSM 15272]
MSDRHANRADLDHLREFIASRAGVEAFVEPATSVTQTTLLLVAGDGEWTRRRIASAQAAADFARKEKIPVYDTNRVGIPQRMREFDQRQRRGGPQAGGSRPVANPAPAARLDPRQSAAVMTLEMIAGADPLPDAHDRDDLVTLLRQARGKAHPDRRGGDRSMWDKVEDAARTLDLTD